MTLKLISGDSFPAYIALAEDITSASTIIGASLIGKTIYITDEAAWWIITGSYTNAGSGLLLAPFQFPTAIA